MKQTEFEKLPKNVQDFRWALFLESDGYEKEINEVRIQQLAKEYGVDLNVEDPVQN
jgi:hypothetical protein